MTWLPAAARSRWLPPVLLALILGLDAISRAVPFQIFVTGILDEPAHLATAGLLLLALVGAPWLLAHRAFAVTAVVASVAIDADHIPLYLGVPHIADGGRPYSHSLLTVAVLAAVWWVTGRRWPVLAGAAVGVVLHFVRDVATGPGLQLFWPLSPLPVALRYAWYVTALVALTALATVRAVRKAASPRLPRGVRARSGHGPSSEDRTPT